MVGEGIDDALEPVAHQIHPHGVVRAEGEGGVGGAVEEPKWEAAELPLGADVGTDAEVDEEPEVGGEADEVVEVDDAPVRRAGRVGLVDVPEDVNLNHVQAVRLERPEGPVPLPDRNPGGMDAPGKEERALAGEVEGAPVELHVVRLALDVVVGQESTAGRGGRDRGRRPDEAPEHHRRDERDA